jgi:hypothetical protein
MRAVEDARSADEGPRASMWWNRCMTEPLGRAGAQGRAVAARSNCSLFTQVSRTPIWYARGPYRHANLDRQAMDDFTLLRITRFIGSFKKDHGRDPSHADLERAGFANPDIDYVVRRGAVDKYHVTTGTGARENRYKLHRDWRSLRSD